MNSIYEAIETTEGVSVAESKSDGNTDEMLITFDHNLKLHQKNGIIEYLEQFGFEVEQKESNIYRVKRNKSTMVSNDPVLNQPSTPEGESVGPRYARILVDEYVIALVLVGCVGGFLFAGATEETRQTVTFIVYGSLYLPLLAIFGLSVAALKELIELDW